MTGKKKTPELVLKSKNNSNESSPPSKATSSPPVLKRDKDKKRQVSLQECAILINRDRNTIKKYIDQGCPVVSEADRARGVAWTLDLGEVVRWLEERSAKNISEKFGADSDQMPEDEAKRRRAVAVAFSAEFELAEEVKIIARIHDMLDLVRNDYTELNLRLQSIPDALASKFNDENIKQLAKETSEELIINALKTLTADKKIEDISKDS